MIKTFMKTRENIPEIPAQDRVFQILRRRMMIAAKWARSPTNLKMFILEPTTNSDTKPNSMNSNRHSLLHLFFKCQIKKIFFSQNFPNGPMCVNRSTDIYDGEMNSNHRYLDRRIQTTDIYDWEIDWIHRYLIHWIWSVLSVSSKTRKKM